MNDMYSLRWEFLKLLTKDSETQDRRRKDYNQAVFSENGRQAWTHVDLDMIMEKFDRAVSNINHLKEHRSDD